MIWNPNEPLGLPRGSVRAMLALIVTLAMIVLAAVKTDINQILAGGISGAFGTIIGLYFGERKGEPGSSDQIVTTPQRDPLFPGITYGSGNKP